MPFCEYPVKPSAALLAILLLACGPAQRGAPDIEVDGAWARATTPGKTATAAYLTITNRGTIDDALLGVTSGAGVAQVHSTSMAGGVMRMRKRDRLAIPAGATVKLEPGGTHLMLTGLQGPLAAGRKVDLTLRFERSGERKVAATVRDFSGDRI